ncbi:MAG: hypothetical protein AAF806_18050 [Bacteroidota bacterium]
MKNITLFVFALFIASISIAQNANYTAAMEKAIDQLENIESLDEVPAIANTFERISKVAPEEWLPQYYLTYTNVMLAWKGLQESDVSACDRHVEAAQKALKAAKEIAGEHSELYVMEAYIYQARIMRNPMVNGARFSGSVDEALAVAKKLDADNPRAYYLQGQQWLNMPAFLGGGKEKAMPEFKTAEEKFKTFEPTSSLHPNWGRQNNEQVMAQLMK